MKILTAVKSSGNAKKLSQTTLSWAPRAGFDFRIFIPDHEQAAEYIEWIGDAEQEHYLDLKGILVIGRDPEEFAKDQKYDLLLELPDDLKRWCKSVNKDKMVIDYAVEVARARSNFNTDPSLEVQSFPNGTKIIRL